MRQQSTRGTTKYYSRKMELERFCRDNCGIFRNEKSNIFYLKSISSTGFSIFIIKVMAEGIRFCWNFFRTIVKFFETKGTIFFHSFFFSFEQSLSLVFFFYFYCKKWWWKVYVFVGIFQNNCRIFRKREEQYIFYSLFGLPIFIIKITVKGTEFCQNNSLE